MQTRFRVGFRFVVLGMLLAAPPAWAQQGPLRGLSEYIERGMKQWEVPGLAIAVVRNDSVVYAQGFGVRELGKPDRVDPQTMFAIGSASKAFTAATVGMLVDAGQVSWNDPATKHLPELQLFDPYVTRELTVRDLLSHRSGLSRGDLLWYATDLDRDQILRGVRHLEPTWSFRSNFGYQNIMYLAAGQIVPAVTSRSWDDFVRERIFTPLGMQQSNTSTVPLRGMPNVAQPHARIDASIRPVPYRNIDNVAPAGSINSNVLEMARWIELQLNHGEFRGKRILKKETVEEMHTPHTVMRLEGAWQLYMPEANLAAYGLGWMLSDYRGRKVVQHGGNIDGMHAMVGMLPEEDLGVVILTNLSPNSLTSAIMYRIFDAYLGAPATDWSTRLKTATDSLRAIDEAQQKKVEAARVQGTSPSLALASYAGTYRNPMYGDATVTLENGRLVLKRGANLIGDLEHWHFDTFRAVWRDPVIGKSFVTFALDPMAKVRSMEVEQLAEYRRVEEAETQTQR